MWYLSQRVSANGTEVSGGSVLAFLIFLPQILSVLSSLCLSVFLSFLHNSTEESNKLFLKFRLELHLVCYIQYTWEICGACYCFMSS